MRRRDGLLHPRDKRNGMSALQLQKQLGIDSCKSAWLLAMKLRQAMVDPGRTPLAGLVEADEASIALRSKTDPPAGGQGRSHRGKMLLVVSAEVVSEAKTKIALGRIRLAPIADYSHNSLRAFLARNVAKGARLRTDGWSGYPGVPGLEHAPHTVGKMPAHTILPAVHRVISNLKAWALGVYAHTSEPTSRNSSSASTGAETATPASPPFSASVSATPLSPTRC